MARRKDKEKALLLRQQGASYSEIKERLKISKSTLSYWLRDYPLSDERIKELRDNNPRRIEKFRNTMRAKQEKKFQEAYQQVSKDIGKMSKRELFIAGFFLYWAEGGKTQKAEISMANTDPSLIRFFIQWVQILGGDKNSIRVRLQLYSDMNVEKEINFWSKAIDINKTQFRKPYIKKTKFANITYKVGYNHGTCNIAFGGKKFADYTFAGLHKLQKSYGIDKINL